MSNWAALGMEISMGVGKRLISGSVFRNFEFLATVVVTFVMSPLIIQSLGDRMYGFWVLIGTFMGYYGLLDFGLSSAVNRFISQAVGMEDTTEVSTIVSTSFAVFSLLGLLSLIVTAVLVSTCHLFIDNAQEIALFRKTVSLLGVSLAIGFPMRVFNGILTSYLRYDVISVTSIVKTVITNTAIYFYLNNGYGITALANIIFIGNLLHSGFMFAACRMMIPQAKLAPAFFNRERIEKLIRFSANTFVVQIADLLRFRLDSVILAAFVNVSAVTYYSIGYRLVEYFIQFMTSSIGIMMPIFSQYEGKQDYDSIRKSFLMATTVSSILAVYLGLSILFYGKSFIVRWMGPGFITSYNITLIFIVPVIFALIQIPSINLLYAISKHHYYARSNVCEGIVNLILSLILVKTLGIYGVALATALAMTFFKLLVQPILTCRVINISFKSYCIDTILVTTTKVTVPLLLYFWVIRNLITPDYFNILGLFAVQTVLGLLVVYFWVFGQQQRNFIKSAIGTT